MSKFIDTTGKANLGIGICGRCARKFPLVELRKDSNSPGLMVCRDDWDELDRDRLPPRKPESIVLRNIRPDVPVVNTPIPDEWETP